MEDARITAFSDGVFAILITIMVLDLHAPVSAGFKDLVPLIPVFLAYALSFTMVAIYWNNHQLLMKFLKKPNTAVLWSNSYLLFWLSFNPFVTAWMGSTYGTVASAATYGFVQLMCATAYFWLQHEVLRTNGERSAIREEIGNDMKGKISAVLITLGTISAFISPWISYALFVSVSVLWLFPDHRLVRAYHRTSV